MQKLFIPKSVKMFQVIIKYPPPHSLTATGEPIPGAEVIISQIPDEDSVEKIILEDTGDIDIASPGKTIIYSFVNR